MRDDDLEDAYVRCAHPLVPFRASLCDNNIDPDGVQALARSLVTNTALTKLE